MKAITSIELLPVCGILTNVEKPEGGYCVLFVKINNSIKEYLVDESHKLPDLKKNIGNNVVIQGTCLEFV